jgi:polyisoprenoid-binding protein YceI
MKLTKFVVAVLATGIAATSALAADTYTIEPTHTYPSFEADHKGGLSVWRGKFDKTSGSITLDRAAKTGTLNIVIDTSSINFGLKAMDDHAKKEDMFNVAKFPTATYKGTSIKFSGDTPVAVEGEFTLMGVTKPLTLTINKFKCVQDPRLKREVCGADASAEFKRTDYGFNFASPPFFPEVKLAIQVEAIKTE